MTINSKREYLHAIRLRYRTASKKAKGPILDEFCTICGYNRKYAIRLINKKSKKHKRKPGPKPMYQDKTMLVPLKRIWFATDQMCSKKLHAAPPIWCPFYKDEYGALEHEVKRKLLTTTL